MAVEPEFDLIVRDTRLVRPLRQSLDLVDIGIRGGKVAAVAPGLDVSQARKVLDAKGRLAFPGVIDAHMHTGIYSPLAEDAVTESRAAAQGGVTTSLNYFRSGQYYLNKGGPYAEFFPEVLDISRGRFHVDYAYHLAPMDARQISEIPLLIEKYGVTSFKIYMFYGGYGLHGASSHQRDFLMIGADEKYDIAHFEFVMRGVQNAVEQFPALRDELSLSMHCETAEIMNAYTRIVQREGKLSGLRAYSAARPPHSEGLAIFIAGYLANETNCCNINLLHLSSRKAVEAALQMANVFPHINFHREATIGHLCLDFDSPAGALAKVNPPIRSREDVEFLWQALLEGQIDWICSDHACCRHETKLDPAGADKIWLAKSGFGGTEYLLPALITEGRRRGLSFNRIAELLAWNPSRRFGLRTKGDIAPGFDADIALVDPSASWTIHAQDSESTQGYTPFEGHEMSAKVVGTLLRGELIFENGNIAGAPRGQYLHRPYG
jgi:allantoinase